MPSSFEYASPLPSTTVELQDNLFLRFLVRIRYLIFAVLALALAASFNGQWRVGRDSALYCDIARNLAEGRGYTFRGEREHHVYPGLPLLLATTEKLFGPQDPLHPTAYLGLMLILGGLTLVVVYLLVGSYYPTWVAVCVTTGVGINKLFLEHSNELMADVPFLLGVCLTLLGLSRLPRAVTRWGKAGGIVLVAVGVCLAISMRPTFWALAAAMLGASIVGLLHASPQRRKYGAIGLAAMVALALMWLLLDPRLRGHLFNGQYEKSAVAHLSLLGSQRWTTALVNTFSKHLPDALLGFWGRGVMGCVLAGMSLVLVGAAYLLMRKSLVLALYVGATVIMILLLGSVPRYFLMVLPMLLIEWALLTHLASRYIAKIVPWRFTPDWVMLIGLAIPTVGNVGQSFNFVMEQHGRDILIGQTTDGRHGGLGQLLRGNLQVRKKPFLEVYRAGKMLPVIRLAEMIRATVPPGDRVLAPEPRILTYMSQRAVFSTADLLANKQGGQWLAILKRKDLRWVVWGPRFTEEKRIVEVLRKRVVEVVGESMPGEKSGAAWIEVEPVGHDAQSDQAEGIYFARIQPRTSKGDARPVQIVNPKRLPALEWELYGSKPKRLAVRSAATVPGKKKPRTQPHGKPRRQAGG